MIDEEDLEASQRFARGLCLERKRDGGSASGETADVGIRRPPGPQKIEVLLKELVETYGVSGHEGAVRQQNSATTSGLGEN